MMNHYRGKNGRLPAGPGESLNQRLEAGETGEPRLEWLNALPAVQARLDREFAGSPIRPAHRGTPASHRAAPRRNQPNQVETRLNSPETRLNQPIPA